MIEAIQNPWPWYVAGPLIGLTVPALLIIGNKALGISSSLKHICAACFPAGIPYLKYKWKDELWSVVLVIGVLIGGFIGETVLSHPASMDISPATMADLENLGLESLTGFVPQEIFSFDQLITLRGMIFIVFGGFLVGFGTRYAEGCTSGHAIMGLSNLQWPSLVAVVGFFAGGLFMTHFVLPFILSL
jgi:uncharacterized protein